MKVGDESTNCGKSWAPSDLEVNLVTFNIIKSKQNNAAKDTVSIELGLPSEFKAAVELGQASFQEGDFLSADIELIVPPRQNANNFLSSQRLRTWMDEAGVDDNHAGGWKLVTKEASELHRLFILQ